MKIEPYVQFIKGKIGSNMERRLHNIIKTIQIGMGTLTICVLYIGKIERNCYW